MSISKYQIEKTIMIFKGLFLFFGIGGVAAAIIVLLTNAVYENYLPDYYLPVFITGSIFGFVSYFGLEKRKSWIVFVILLIAVSNIIVQVVQVATLRIWSVDYALFEVAALAFNSFMLYFFSRKEVKEFVRSS